MVAGVSRFGIRPAVYLGHGHSALRSSVRDGGAVEVLSAGTARTDLRVKLEEYGALATLDTIVFVDVVTERVRVIQRTGPHGFSDVSHTQAYDIPLPKLGAELPHDEIFARD